MIKAETPDSIASLMFKLPSVPANAWFRLLDGFSAFFGIGCQAFVRSSVTD
jgi:hypothetical protein